MNNNFKVSDKVGDIVTKFPKAADVFKKYSIDFCCGGDIDLATAAKEKNVDLAAILSDIISSYSEKSNGSGKDFASMSSSDLIDYIVPTHHDYLRGNLPKINELINKIATVHKEHHGEMLNKIKGLFEDLRAELESHIVKEEQVLFPLIKKFETTGDEGFSDKFPHIINQMEYEHEGAGNILKEIRRLTNDYTCPGDACNTFRLTYTKLEELESDLFQHIHLENNILFPRYQKNNA